MSDPFLLMDRIVTATTMAALVQGLLGLREALRQDPTLKLETNNDNDNNNDNVNAQDKQDEEETKLLWKSLVQILQGTHPACVSATQKDEVTQAVLHLYKQIVTAKPALKSSYYKTWINIKENTWMPALVDVATATATETTATTTATYAAYTRVLALQTILHAGNVQPKITQQALLQTPQALPRLAELITEINEEEQVQTVALAELAPFITKWPAPAKIWAFQEVPQALLKRIVKQQNGWSGGGQNAANTKDAIRCITDCLQHDANSVKLVMETEPNWWPNMARLLDLRAGHYYLHPQELEKQHANKTTTTTTDDLDDLLTADTSHETDETQPKAPVPYLMPAEEEALTLVLELLRTCLQHESVRQSVWKSHRPIMALCWDWACMGPPPREKFPCAFSSVHLQVQVLNLIAEFMNDATVLLDPAWHGLDRLLYLACTGGPGKTANEQWKISQAAVAVLRACLQNDTNLAQECLMAALIPPSQDGQQDEMQRMQETAVPRLLQTVAENLQQTDTKDSRHGVGLVGALSALQLFAGTTEAQKSLLLKLSTMSLLHDAWERLAVECETWQTDGGPTSTTSGTSEEAVEARQMSQTIVVAILRWMGSWMTHTPLVVQGFLQDASSAAIMGQLVKVDRDADQATRTIASVASLVLGIALVHLPTESVDCGGWTPDTIVHVLGRLPARMAAWDAFKKKNSDELLPWTLNEMEAAAWKSWVATQILQVRKALIHFVAGESDKNDDDDDDADDGETPPQDGAPSRKSLQVMLAQQSAETERLQAELHALQLKAQSQEKQLSIWKQRVESSPSELDEMLSDYGSQTTALEETIRTLRVDLESRDEKISTLETKVKELKESEKESNEERDRVQDEMQALSEAYGNLEDEYRRLEQQQQHRPPAPDQVPTTAAGEDPSGALGGTEETTTRAAQQSQGENPDQLASVAAGSTEVATLRAENTRLRESAQQADDWMRMAVDRMNTQDVQLGQTQQRIQQLEAQLGQTAGDGQVSAALTAERDNLQRREQKLRDALEREQMTRGEVEQRLAALLQEQQSRHDQENAIRLELERSLEQARNEVVVLKQEVSLVRSRNDEMVQEDTKTFDALVSQKEAAWEAADAKIMSTKEEANNLRAEKEALQSRLDELETLLEGSHDQDTSDLNDLVALRHKLAQSQANFEALQIQFSTETAQKDSTIRTLESRIFEPRGDLSSGDSLARDAEVEQLRQSNKDAQEWMAQAVQHHNALSEQNASLLAEVSALKEQSSLSKSEDTTVSNLRNEVDTLSKSLDELQSQLTEKEGRIALLVAERDQLQFHIAKEPVISSPGEADKDSSATESAAEVVVLRDENARLRLERAEDARRVEEAELEREQMKSELAVLSHEYEDLEEELAALRQGTAPNEPQPVPEQHESSQLLEELQARYSDLEKRHGETEELLLAAQAANQNGSNMYSSQVSELESTINELREELKKQEAEAREAVSQWMLSHDELKEKYTALQSRVEGSRSDNPNEVDELRKKLEEETAAADDAIAQWQASYNSLKEQYDQLQSQPFGDARSEVGVSELETENHALKKELEEQAAEAEQVIAQWQASLNDLQAQYDALKERGGTSEEDGDVSSLKEEVENLKQQLKDESADAENAVNQWQTSYNELSERYDALEKSAGKTNQDTSILQNEIELLKQQLKEEADDADLVVAKWQSSYEDLKRQYDALASQKGNDNDRTVQSEIEALKKQIQDDSAEAESAIEQWQAAYNDIKEKHDSLKQQFDAASNRADVDDSDELRNEVESLKLQLKDESADADNVINQWQQSYDALKEEYETLSSQIQSVASGSQGTDGGELESLRKQLEDEKAEADAVVAQWEASYNDLQEQYQEMVNQSCKKRSESDVAIVQSIETDEAQQIRPRDVQPPSDEPDTIQLKKEVDELEKKLEESAAEATNAIAQWQDAYNNLQQEFDTFKANVELPKASLNEDFDVVQLQSEVEDLKRRLDEESAEADNVVSQWEASYNDLKDQYESLQATADTGSPGQSDSEVNDLKSRLEILQKQMEEDSSEAQNAIRQWEESYLLLESECNELRAEAQNLPSLADKAEFERLRSEFNEVCRSRDDWKGKFTSLESEFGELKGANDALTDRVNILESTTANDTDHTSVVSELQAEVNSLRAQLESDNRDADDAILQWQESYDLVQNEKQQLADSKKLLEEKVSAALTERDSLIGQVSQLETEKEKQDDDIRCLSKEIEALRINLGELSAVESQELQSEISSLQKQLNEASESSAKIVKQWEESYQALQEDYNHILGELTASKDTVDFLRNEKEKFQSEQASASKAGPLADQLEDLRSELAKLQQDRDNEAREFEGVIDQWQSSYDALQSDFDKIQAELDEALDRIQQLSEEINILQTQCELSADKSRELELLRESISALKRKYDEDGREADEAISQWQESYDELESELANARDEIEAASKMKEDWELHMTALQDRLSELESAMEQTIGSNERLQNQLDEMTSRAKHAENLLEEGPKDNNTSASIGTSVKDFEEVAAKLAASEALLSEETLRANNLFEQVQRLTEELDRANENAVALAAGIEEHEALREQAEGEMDKSEDIINSWKARVDELEGRVTGLVETQNELSEELERTHAEAEEGIAMWEQHCQDLQEQLEEAHGNTSRSELEAELAKLKEENVKLTEKASMSAGDSIFADTTEIVQQLDTEKNARRTAEEKVSTLEKKLAETEVTFTSRLESMQAEQARAKTSDDAKRLHEQERMDVLERENETLRNERTAVESENATIRKQITEQDNEIRELYDNLKLHQTNEISSRAAKIAAEALRKEVDGLRKQLGQEDAALVAERTSRLAAEQEAKRVRADLAALLGVENSDENQNEIRRRTIQATEHFQRKEQAEIEELRTSLNEALNRLDKVRIEAQEAQDRALRAELEFSTVEENLSEAKSNLKHMRIAKEELEAAEGSRRASLEARIDSLEREHLSYRQFHASEMDRLRNELNQITSERDRLTQSLRSAESSKAAVLDSLSQNDMNANVDLELRKLRIENAALLAQASDESARSEKRIREAHAASRSAYQTQVVVERELRLASERALAAANEELSQLRQTGSEENPSAKKRIAELTNDLEEWRSRSEKLSEEKVEMRRQLEEMRRDARHKEEHLQEECRQAKHRVTQLEQKGRFEAEVRAEVARIQSSPSDGKGVEEESRALVEVPPSSVNVAATGDPATVAHLYDVVKSMQQRMDDERRIHEEEREEMEDLLKLVAQQNLDVESLKAALQRVAGVDAVHQALEESEAKAEAQYGRSVRVIE